MSQVGGKRSKGVSRSSEPGKPLISIVTVVWNGAETLERTIKSVLDQDYDNIEYVMVDGASSDGTLDIIKKYDADIDHWVSEKDSGIYDAMNKGVQLCTGQFIALINADDWYMPKAVSRMVKEINANPEKMVFHGDIWIHYPNGTQKIKKARTSKFLLKYWEMVMNHPSFFVHRSLYEKRLFDTQLRVSSDHKWTLTTFLERRNEFHYIAEPISNFSAGGASMTIPLSKVLKEGKQVAKDLGFGPLETMIGQLTKVALYIPQYLKLLMNQYASGSGKAST